MTHTEKIEAMRRLFNDCIAIADAKGKDYAGTGDGMSNLRDFGTTGIVVRIGDKYHRAKQICKTGNVHVTSESLRDTLMDMVNYAALAVLMHDEELQHGKSE